MPDIAADRAWVQFKPIVSAMRDASLAGLELALHDARRPARADETPGMTINGRPSPTAEMATLDGFKRLEIMLTHRPAGRKRMLDQLLQGNVGTGGHGTVKEQQNDG